jgi:hypothetical protein
VRSIGYLNSNTEIAKWVFGTSNVGDVVEVINSGAPQLVINYGHGDLVVSWTAWQARGAPAQLTHSDLSLFEAFRDARLGAVLVPAAVCRSPCKASVVLGDCNSRSRSVSSLTSTK